MAELTDKQRQERARKKLQDALKKLQLAGVNILDDAEGRPHILGAKRSGQEAETIIDVDEDRLSPFIAEAEAMFDLEAPQGSDPYNKAD